jgi:PHD/YefM family antitoxin component YafN of YafNO toxin-antitoxin module
MADADNTRLPVENLEEGLYIWRDMVPVTVTTRGEDVSYLVDASAFMEMQRERDNYRKALALINAWRITPEREESELTRLLDSVGFTHGDAQAMVSLVASVRAGL